ncbi:MAG TPA: hypothetical protein VI583_04640, partial [Cyclobacteriaceae bacterium]|nr:hypothetical protein [Cyclobacteriaceae bacterium]
YHAILFTVILIGCKAGNHDPHDLRALAKSRKSDLKLGVFVTAQAVDQYLSTVEGKREALSILNANGITKVFLEVYRGGLVVPDSTLKSAADFFKENGFEVAGGIATVPGSDFGIRQEARHSWFNWEHQKTQEDLKKVMRDTAPFFDTFIVDDFLCTADTGELSKTAKGNEDWPQYRRELLTRLSSELFIDPPKEVNSGIRMIIKYPQWYDRYHIFGYDVASQPGIFDEVWIGTETRGQYTRRFGYVQPYEGFVNYRWMASLSGNKMGGAWFDHIDCTAEDFIDQAYQSVLAGAKELTLFNYYNFTEGHPGQHLLRMDFEFLADLAKVIAVNPVRGISAYKPPNGDAGGDMYIMDFIGMLGVPLIPCSQYPEDAEVIFLPAQAAADTAILDKVRNSLVHDARIIVTPGFLNRAKDGWIFSDMTGVAVSPEGQALEANEIIVDGHYMEIDSLLELGSQMSMITAVPLLEAVVGNLKVPYLCRNEAGNIYVLNSHTFSEADFAAVGEELLCPNPLGILDLPREWVNTIRNALNEGIMMGADAPARVTIQPFGAGEIMVQNYNVKTVDVKLFSTPNMKYRDVFTRKLIEPSGDGLLLNMPGRSRVWLKPLGTHN